MGGEPQNVESNKELGGGEMGLFSQKSCLLRIFNLHSESGSFGGFDAVPFRSALFKRMLRRRNDPELLLLVPRLRILEPCVILAPFFSSSA